MKISESHFDPFARYELYKANPQAFIRVADIVAEVFALRSIRKAQTMDMLKDAFAEAYRCARDVGDADLMARLKQAYDARKGQLEA